MILGFLQFLELVIYHRLRPFLVFFVLCWSIFSYRIYYSKKHKKYEGSPVNATTSGIVVTYHDDPKYLRKCLESLWSQTLPFTEIILAMDDREAEENRQIAQEYAMQYGFKIVFDHEGNKRTAFAKAFKESSGDIIYMLAGDTLYPPNTVKETLIPFQNAKIGATTLKQRVYDADRTLVRRFGDILYNMRNLITEPSLSSKGVLVCTTGEIGAFRREIIERHLDDFLNESFLGRKCVLGDDRYLTSMVLKEGYDVVMQPTEEIVLTDSPDTLKGFIKQQLRWYRSGVKYSIKTLFFNWIPNKPSMLKIHCFNLLIMPYFFIIVVFCGLLNPTSLLIMSALQGFPSIILSIIGFYLAIFVKSAVHFKAHRKDLKIFPIYVFFGVCVTLSIFVYATLTMWKQGEWLTK